MPLHAVSGHRPPGRRGRRPQVARRGAGAPYVPLCRKHLDRVRKAGEKAANQGWSYQARLV